MLSTRTAGRHFHATAKVLAGVRGGRRGEFLPDVPFFCTAILVGSWKGPRLALPSGNCSSPQQLWSPILPPLPWQPAGQDQAVSLLPQLRVFAFLLQEEKHPAALQASFFPRRLSVWGLLQEASGEKKMHFRAHFCVHSSLQSPWGEVASKAGAWLPAKDPF